nr:helix-turn-helix domain-containing protein [Ligilactobacillus ruminis]
MLFVHRKTVWHRLKLISEISGCNLLSYDECFACYLACIAYRLIN